MDTTTALTFLAANQPLPPDALLGDRIRMFDAVRTFFSEHYDERAIPLLLHAFGDGDGFGVYQLVEDTMLRYPKAVVVPALERALQSPQRSVRYWNAQLAAVVPDARLVAPLAALLHEDDDMWFAAVTALAQMQSVPATAVLRDHLTREPNHELQTLIAEALLATS